MFLADYECSTNASTVLVQQCTYIRVGASSSSLFIAGACAQIWNDVLSPPPALKFCQIGGGTIFSHFVFLSLYLLSVFLALSIRVDRESKAWMSINQSIKQTIISLQLTVLSHSYNIYNHDPPLLLLLRH